MVLKTRKGYAFSPPPVPAIYNESTLDIVRYNVATPNSSGRVEMNYGRANSRQGAKEALGVSVRELDTEDAVELEMVEIGKWGQPIVELYTDGWNVSD